jgi:hypothetical protein
VKELQQTSSLCPECLKTIPATIFEESEKVWIRKECNRHGKFTDLYWGSIRLYNKAKRFSFDGRKQQNPNIEKQSVNCPRDCGLCSEHLSHSALTNLVATNRCDLSCWYCFFYAQKSGYVYEPTVGQIREMVRLVRKERPIKGNALQITGGEPTLREDLIEIIRAVKEEGIDHVQLNTNGIRFALEPGLARKVRGVGVNTIYLSFDGVSAATNPKNHWEVPLVLRNCRAANLGIVLVPTIMNTVNDHEAGKILRFGFENVDIVRGVNFQPVSLVGRVPKKERERFRITIPDVIQRIEEQTGGEITRDDFYPVPTVAPISRFVEGMTGKPQYDLSTHFACGMATYVFKHKGKMLPITRFLDVDAFVEFLREKTEQLSGGKHRYLIGAESLWKFNSFVDKQKMPRELNLVKLLFNVFIKHDYKALSVFHHKSLFIGLMHFMDLYNYDVERVKRCCIHYATPSKENPIVPFCAFNVIPEWYRDKIQRQFGVPIAEWERATGKKISSDFYVRDIPALQEKARRSGREKEMQLVAR